MSYMSCETYVAVYVAPKIANGVLRTELSRLVRGSRAEITFSYETYVNIPNLQMVLNVRHTRVHVRIIHTNPTKRIERGSSTKSRVHILGRDQHFKKPNKPQIN